ncbi:DUF2442 domain-containing protein [Cyanobium sp. ATX 6A2]|uniref:DUF2442 domain-containing protein n=1 Tax=Cyanobium sp. ATX 6A2 TaxID=2823700 RepID=UPI0020CCB936|nr:DUF2442 domain-containing protein [Cyanobium sp. ATX 6A2]MCP9886780.1 DUF2442 domain-containing protein [Cyanobium sp. ATX 6A2]
MPTILRSGPYRVYFYSHEPNEPPHVHMANPGEQVTDVALTEDRLIVDLADGRSISVPLAWFPRLLHATSQERENWEIAGSGYGIHWPDVDEDLSVEGLLCGAPAHQAKALVS